MTNTTKFYEILKSRNTTTYEEHVAFFTTIEGAINWLKSIGTTCAHEACTLENLCNAKWYGVYEDKSKLYEDILTKTYVTEKCGVSYRVVEQSFED